MVDDALRDFAAKNAPVPSSDPEAVQKGRLITQAVVKLGRQILLSEPNGEHNPEAFKELLKKLFRDNFVSFSKEEMLELLVVLHTEIVTEKLR